VLLRVPNRMLEAIIHQLAIKVLKNTDLSMWLMGDSDMINPSKLRSIGNPSRRGIRHRVCAFRAKNEGGTFTMVTPRARITVDSSIACLAVKRSPRRCRVGGSIIIVSASLIMIRWVCRANR
jgi:hypothetical protein